MKTYPPTAFVLGTLLIYPGLALQIVMSMTTVDHLKIGFLWPLVVSACIALAAIIPVFILRAIVASLSCRGRWPLWLGSKTILGIASAISLLLAGAGVYSATPLQRYLKLVGNGDNDGASEIKASGFNSFLATRWLVTFKIDQQGAERIRTRWELEKTEPFSLKERIASDPVFSSSGSALLAELPEAQGVKYFIKKSDSTKTSTETWITFAVRDSDGQAWFFGAFKIDRPLGQRADLISFSQRMPGVESKREYRGDWSRCLAAFGQRTRPIGSIPLGKYRGSISVACG